MLRQHLNGERRQFDECLSIQFVWNRDDFFSLLYTTLRRKLLRMKKIEKERVIMPDEDIMDNIETAYMGTLYTYLRSLYNDKHLYVENSPLIITSFHIPAFACSIDSACTAARARTSPPDFSRDCAKSSLRSSCSVRNTKREYL